MGWKPLEFDERGMTKWNWVCQYHEHAVIGKADIGAFTYINAHYGVVINDDVQIGSHCSIYSHSSIDNKKGTVVIAKGARVGSHSIIMPGVVIGEGALVGAFSLVKQDVPAGEFWCGIPAKHKIRNKV